VGKTVGRILTERMLRDLAAELGGMETTVAWLQQAATTYGVPIGVHVVHATAFIPPVGWSSDRLRLSESPSRWCRPKVEFERHGVALIGHADLSAGFHRQTGDFHVDRGNREDMSLGALLPESDVALSQIRIVGLLDRALDREAHTDETEARPYAN
jgi:hypothetical protein